MTIIGEGSGLQIHSWPSKLFPSKFVSFLLLDSLRQIIILVTRLIISLWMGQSLQRVTVTKMAQIEVVLSFILIVESLHRRNRTSYTFRSVVLKCVTRLFCWSFFKFSESPQVENVEIRFRFQLYSRINQNERFTLST